MLLNKIIGAIRKLFGFYDVANQDTANGPMRPLEQPFEVVKSVVEGPESDPDAMRLTLRVVASDQHVGIRLVHFAVQDWRYDFASARLVNAEGEKIPGKAGTLPDNIRGLLVATFGHADLKDAPAPSYG